MTNGANKATYERPIGPLYASHNRCSGPKTDVFESYVDGLHVSEGYSLDETTLKDPSEVQEMQLFTKSEGTIRFHGQAMLARLTALAPSVCGDPYGRQQIAKYELGDNLVIGISEESFLRSLKGSSGKTESYWREALRGKFLPDVKGADRNRIFFGGLCALHGFMTAQLADLGDPEEQTLYRNLRDAFVGSMLTSGRCRNEVSERLKDALEGLVNSKCELPLAVGFKKFSLDFLAKLYKLRKMIPKDDYDPLANGLAAATRFAGAPRGEPMCSAARRGLDLLKKKLTAFLEDASEVQKAEWRTPHAFHQGGAGMFFVRAQGGRNAEMQMIVGLHRLARGFRSTLTDVFGTFPDPLDLTTLLDMTKEVLFQEEEVVEACEWFFDEWQSMDLPLLFLSIRPAREVKSRTFAMFDYASQLGGYAWIPPLVAFLKTTVVREAFTGQRGRVLADKILTAHLPRGSFVVAADASTSTDTLEWGPIHELIDVMEPFVHPFATRVARRVFSPTKMAATTIRDKTHPIERTQLGRDLFDGLGGRPSPHLEEIRRRRTYQVPEAFLRTPEKIPNVRLREKTEEIYELFRENRVIGVKCMTGSGKTVFGASAFPSIIQFPSIAAMKLFKATADHFELETAIYFSGQKDLLPPGTGAYLCTASYVEMLAKKDPSRVVVLDEAEAFMDNHLLNLYQAGGWTNRVMITSATPEALHLPEVPWMDFDLPSPFEVEDLVVGQEELVHFVVESGRKTLICVHSEPLARSLAGQISATCEGRLTVLVLDSAQRSGDYQALVAGADVILSTNVIRSSVTIPGLEDVFDFETQYLEIDFVAQGFRSLTLFKVTKAQKTQLRGRVGRVGPGRYFRVSSKFKPHDLPKLMPTRLDKIAQKLTTIRVEELAQPVACAPLLVECFAQIVQRRLFGVGESPGQPLAVRAVKENLRSGAKEVATVLAFESMGLAQRIAGYREVAEDSGDDTEVRNLPAALLEAEKGDDYGRDLGGLLESLGSNPVFENQIRLIDSWTADLKPAEEWEEPLRGSVAEGLLAGFLWRSLVRLTETNYVGMLRDLSVRARSRHPFAVLCGVSAMRGRLSYRVAIPISEEVALRIAEEFSAIQEFSVSEHALLPESQGLLWLKLEATEKAGRQGAQSVLEEGGGSTQMVHRPDEIFELFHSLVVRQRSAVQSEVKVSRIGCPQSHSISFPLLNALNLAAILGTEAAATEADEVFEATGYGDDLLGAGPEDFCEMVLEARESFGLMTNKAGTGISRLGEPGLTVFCEILWDLRWAKRVEAPKPRMVANFLAASRPNAIANDGSSFMADLESLDRVFQAKFSTFHDVLADYGEVDGDRRRAVRWTMPRYFTTQVIRSDYRGESVAVSRSSEADLVKFVESLVLTICPSTKASPGRLLRDEEEPPRVLPVTMSTALTLENFLQDLPKTHPMRERFPDFGIGEALRDRV